MTPEDEKEIAALMRAALAKSRGYADFFGWAIDRDLEEWGVTTALSESLECNGESFFSDLKRRGRGNDPPDLEAKDASGKRIAIEVTELVNGRAIQAYKNGGVYEWADWSKDGFVSALAERIADKGKRYATLKGGPYDGGYIIVIYTDEPMLPIATVKGFLDGHSFPRPHGVTRVFLLVSYDPTTKSYPYVDLRLSG
ncbi:hypothetical protein L0Z36_14035 [Burkholderia multivorans]|uniref:hypothetical protein n=1 Tax=Burkholderia multivorans TaxID=87883 RepID=UPI001C237DF5|nr:hypothetical protein [Burkholderia multivorans]MBU9210093.1 hypothetical protein [Burkholderia multivorans]MCO1460199.1 hypothetical protein [Burkholderia multivorans]UQP00003.1 hypothetical protein L0Z36_14035 [Burkholderia multivorans]